MQVIFNSALIWRCDLSFKRKKAKRIFSPVFVGQPYFSISSDFFFAVTKEKLSFFFSFPFSLFSVALIPLFSAAVFTFVSSTENVFRDSLGVCPLVDVRLFTLYTRRLKPTDFKGTAE